MINIIFGIFIVLHGLVHLLYAGQSTRLFELRANLTWPDNAWLFSKILGNDTTRLIASALLILTALGFITGSLGLLFRQEWSRPVTVASAVVSAVLFIVFWNGKLQELPDQGAVGVLIDLAILGIVRIL